MALTASPIINISYEESDGNLAEAGSARGFCIPTQKSEGMLRGLIHSSGDLKQTGTKLCIARNQHSQLQQSEYLNTARKYK